MSKRKLPHHIPGTIKAWRTKKRRELDAAIKAMHVFLIGCAYTPARDTGIVLGMMEKNRAKLSVKEWK